MKALVTGGAGFIGNRLVKTLLSQGQHKVYTVDKLTYASSLENLATVLDHEHHIFEETDILETTRLLEICRSFQPDTIFHLAAESHVDNSIVQADRFAMTNMLGTQHLLDATLTYWRELSLDEQYSFRFINISTDEVFGSLSPQEPGFTENSPYQPNSPYAATKAGADMLVRSYHQTYGLPVITSHCSNNFGPYQYPEKLIPKCILNAIRQRPIPLYGDGQQSRDWIYVQDHVDALILLRQQGLPGEQYCIGGANEITNIELLKRLCQILDVCRPLSQGQSYQDYITSVTDRAGHDRRYSLQLTKMSTELNWKPRYAFTEYLESTVHWYLENHHIFRRKPSLEVINA